jgi:DNA-binding LacI/PurR family transcriptional regulator
VTPVWACTRGTEAPQTPQNEPNEAKATKAAVVNPGRDLFGVNIIRVTIHNPSGLVRVPWVTLADGTRRPTLAQVAALAGVSVMTASYVYNQPGRVSPEARAKVFAAAEQLGYAGPDPKARSLRRGTTRSLGIVLGEHLSYAFEDPQASSFLAGIAQVCAESGYSMTILPIGSADEDAGRVGSAAVDVFVVWTTADDDPVLDALRASKRPTVVHSGPAVPWAGLVSIDNQAAAYAIGAAAFAGCRIPAVLSFPVTRERLSTMTTGAGISRVTYPVTRDRLAGFRQAAEDAGHAWRDVVVAICTRNDRREAHQMAKSLLGLDRAPDAIAAMSDEQAAGAFLAAAETGRSVPGQLAITGWDDDTVAGELGLTTIGQSLYEQGAACARAALGREHPPERAPWSLILRTSTRR